MKTNNITELFNIQYPIIQAGMVWCSGWKLASAVSQAGGLGLIGAGSMHPETLQRHIQKCKAATNKPFGVNVPLLYPNIQEIMDILVAEKVKIVFTSAGNPATWTSFLKEKGMTVVHVVSSLKFALKAEKCGVDAIVAEGFEAGGHNGRDETTTLCLTPSVAQTVKIPVIAAGGISNGQSMLACFALGAQGIQMGSRFAICQESSAHEHFKQTVIDSKEGDTMLSLKELTPVRLLKNKFWEATQKATNNGATKEDLQTLLSKGRAKKGIFEGDLNEGELEIGQVAATISDNPSAQDIVLNTWNEFITAKNKLNQLF